jgi:acylphosphatase
MDDLKGYGDHSIEVMLAVEEGQLAELEAAVEQKKARVEALQAEKASRQPPAAEEPTTH